MLMTPSTKSQELYWLKARPLTMPLNQLDSRTIEVNDACDATHIFYEKGWTDGLPIIPPTADRVREMLNAGKLAPRDLIGTFVQRKVDVTAEKVAINAVMAGCLPSYMPVIVAAVKAMLHVDFGLHGILATTGGAAVMVIVNGPITQRLKINSGLSCFGPGHMANATIGRAIELINRNIFGRNPGALEKAVFGNPAKYTFCVAEDESDTRWNHLQTQRGLPAGDAVTVFPAQGSGFLIVDPMSASPEELLLSVARKMRSVHISRFGRSFQLMVFSPEAFTTLADAGWREKDVKQFLYENATWTVAELKTPPRLGRTTEIDGIDLMQPIQDGDSERRYSILPEPDAILIITAGSLGQRMVLVVPSMAEYQIESAPVTLPIDRI